MTSSAITLTIHAGPHDRRDCPVAMPWPDDRPLPAAVLLVDDAGRARHTQIGHAEDGFRPTLLDGV